MSIRTAEPLPECRLCDRPVARATFDRNQGLCTDCTDGIDATVRMLLPTGVTDLTSERERRQKLLERADRQDDATVYVERFLPDVPGQLELPEEDRCTSTLCRSRGCEASGPNPACGGSPR